MRARGSRDPNWGLTSIPTRSRSSPQNRGWRRTLRASYRKGLMGLAYEIVINSSPCISYLIEENTATMQALVIAHAAFGHNHFFKNNYLFRQWTDAEGSFDYLDFAKSYA